MSKISRESKQFFQPKEIYSKLVCKAPFYRSKPYLPLKYGATCEQEKGCYRTTIDSSDFSLNQNGSIELKVWLKIIPKCRTLNKTILIFLEIPGLRLRCFRSLYAISVRKWMDIKGNLRVDWKIKFKMKLSEKFVSFILYCHFTRPMLASVQKRVMLKGRMLKWA